jgi:hypothetical protein
MTPQPRRGRPPKNKQEKNVTQLLEHSNHDEYPTKPPGIQPESTVVEKVPTLRPSARCFGMDHVEPTPAVATNETTTETQEVVSEGKLP